MNFKLPTITPPVKPLLVILAVVAITALFIYAQIMRSSFIAGWFLVLIILIILSIRFSAINMHMITILFYSALIYLSLYYGALVQIGKGSFMLAFFAAIAFCVLFFYPMLLTYLNLTLILVFVSSAYGAAEWSPLMALFGRGAGKFSISYVNMLLYFTAISVFSHMIIRKHNENMKIHCNLFKYFLVFNGVFFIYILWGINLGISMKEILSSYGVINITNLTIIVFMLLHTFRTEKNIEQLKYFFLSLMLMKGLWVIYRFFFLGGDQRNPYANYAGILTAKITIFGIGDLQVQCVAVFYALWMLFVLRERILSKKETLFFWLIASVGLFNILFSMRRTAWFGLLLPMGWFFFNVSREKKIITGIISLLIVFTIFTGISTSRFQMGEKKYQGLFFDISTTEGVITAEQGRFVELNMAWQTIKDNLLFGVGPWGKYEITKRRWAISSHLTHSAITHIILKMGIIGFAISISILAAYTIFWLKHRKEIPLHRRGFAEAAFAGFLFTIPNIIFGTPIVEYKIMLLLGFCFAVPYMIYNVEKSRHTTISRKN